MAGSISLSLSQQFDEHGKPLSGGRLYFIQAGTVAAPQNAFQDIDLTIPHPNPIILDAAGRVPAFYLADGQIKVRLESKTGVAQIVQDNLLVIGPSSGGGGGGGGVDPTTIYQVGDVMWLDQSGARTGWVRDNGRSIGSSTSGATERANADCQALFVWLWATYSNTICPVSGGRGVNAAADWAANKTIQLPDKRGYVVGGLDDMGNSAAGRYVSVPVASGDATTPGSILGEATTVLATANLPPYTPSGNVGIHDPGHAHGGVLRRGGVGANNPGGIGPSAEGGTDGATTGIWADFSGNAQGGTSTPHNNVQKTVLGTFYRKL
jgi:hypothetical protein